MAYKKIFISIFIVSLTFCGSCLHSRTTAPSFAAGAGIKIFSGRALVKINGKVNENLY
jgi:hypothetical protein